MKPKTPTQRWREWDKRRKDGKVLLTFEVLKTKVSKVTEAVKRIIGE